MIWRCVCGRPNLEVQTQCVDCGRSRDSADQSAEGAGEESRDVLESREAPVASLWGRWQQPQAPAPGFVGRALRRVLIHYRRVLPPFVPGLVLLTIPIQVGYLEIARAVVESRAASWSTLTLAAVLTGLVTLASYYLIVLTSFSVRDEELDLTPFYTQPPWPTLGILWLATVLYGLAFIFGLLLLVVPGLVVLTLLSLVQPLVVLDDATVTEAFRASPRLVIGRGGVQALQVLAIILVTELALTGVSFFLLMPLSAVAERVAWPHLVFAGEIAIGGLLFPIHAVALTILYDELVGIPRPEASA
ncbi:MAG: hypothetical protein ACE5KY_05735 [Candidatus Tectimicrobiota bacterium]